MYKVTCYKVKLSSEQFIELPADAIKSMCEFDYEIDVTPEIFYSIRSYELRFNTGNIDKTHTTVIAYYLVKCFEVGES